MTRSRRHHKTDEFDDREEDEDKEPAAQDWRATNPASYNRWRKRREYAETRYRFNPTGFEPFDEEWGSTKYGEQFAPSSEYAEGGRYGNSVEGARLRASAASDEPDEQAQVERDQRGSSTTISVDREAHALVREGYVALGLQRGWRQPTSPTSDGLMGGPEVSCRSIADALADEGGAHHQAAQDAVKGGTWTQMDGAWTAVWGDGTDGTPHTDSTPRARVRPQWYLSNRQEERWVSALEAEENVRKLVEWARCGPKRERFKRLERALDAANQCRSEWAEKFVTLLYTKIPGLRDYVLEKHERMSHRGRHGSESQAA